MENKEIEKYIQFAIDNGYDIKGTRFEIQNEDEFFGMCINVYLMLDYTENIEREEYSHNIEKTITGYDFIKSIAIGLYKNGVNEKGLLRINNFGLFLITKEGKLQEYSFNSLIDKLTEKQAFAIRDNKLEEFINTII